MKDESYPLPMERRRYDVRHAGNSLYKTPTPTKELSEYYEMVVLAMPGSEPRA
jgi:hypothetical protein